MKTSVVFPTYYNIYDGDLPTLQNLLSDIPSEVIISIACYINTVKHINFFDRNNDIEITKKFIERLPIENQAKIINRFYNFASSNIKQGLDYIIFPLPQILELIVYALENFKEGQLSQIDPIQEENILKAILLINHFTESKQIKNIKELTGNKLMSFINFFWPAMLSIRELLSYKEMVIPLYRSTFLFEFFKSTEKYKPFLVNYLTNNNVETFEEYLKHLIGFYINGFNKSKGSFYTFFSEESFHSNPVFRNYYLDLNNIEKIKDSLNNQNHKIKILRDYPIIRSSEGKYFISNWNFIIDKLYEGFKFDFFNNSGIKEKLKGDNETEKYNSFTSDINQKFNEKIIFRDIVERYLNRNEAICFYDGDGKNWNQDLYLRKNNHIIIAEFKGSTLPLSDSFEKIENDVKERMIYNNVNNRPKAVCQIIDQIDKLHSNHNYYENLDNLGYSKNRLFIYPVIIYTDSNWGLNGINEYIIKDFRNRIIEKNYKFFLVNDIVMIPLNFFMEYENLFIKDNLDLHQLINVWNSYRSIFREEFNRFPSADSAARMFACFDFYMQKSYPDKKVEWNKISIFNELMEKLGILK